MSITAGSDIKASDFINDSQRDATPANDTGRVPKLESDAKIARTFLRSSFGGTGADGALSITSGTTTISAASALVLVKNYTSISITSTGKLAFSNPHNNGTLIVLKSQGACTLTSSTAPMIDASGMGATTSTIGNGSLTTADYGRDGVSYNGGGGGGGGASNVAGAQGGACSYSPGNGVGGVGGVKCPITYNTTNINDKFLKHLCGGGGGNGAAYSSGSGGSGSRGGGALYIECAGAWNFTTANGISVAGIVGGAASGGFFGNGGGGGGGGGSFFGLYNTLTANSGTVNSSGGAGGAHSTGVNGSGGDGGAGGNGYSLVAQNTEFA